MKDTLALIARLRELDVQLQLRDGRLVTRAEPGAITNEVAAHIRAQREELIAFLRQREATSALRMLPITAGSPGDLVLSHAQRRLWLIERMGNAGASYNLPSAIRIEGHIDPDAMQHAFATIVNRHRVLRTTYFDEAGEPGCRVMDEAMFRLNRADLTGREGAEQDTLLRDIIAEECKRRFDLERDLMLRATLVGLEADRHVLLLNMHHIASDGWSMGVLVDEFVQVYQAIVNGRAANLRDLSVQYDDYARWLHDWIEQGMLRHQLDYWKQRLAGVPQLHGLPTDRPRPPVLSFAGAVHTYCLGAEESSGFLDFCRKEGVTPFTAMQLAFAILLSRWSNEDDIVFGTPIAGRVRPELEGLIGFFVNTLVIRNRIDPHQSFRQALAEAARTVATDYDHQIVPFDLIVDMFNPERTTSHAPLVQIMFALQNNAKASTVLQGVSLAPVDMPMETAKFDLTLNVGEDRGLLTTSWEYSTALFDNATIRRMAEHYARLLSSIAIRPDIPIHKLHMLSPAEVGQLVDGLNGTRGSYPETSIPHVFQDQVRRHGERIALMDGNEELSYSSLAEKVRRLATYLCERGIADEERVGICMDRGTDMIVAMLAVLHAGGAYVPLDLSMPSDRMALIARDAGCQLILCTERTKYRIEAVEGEAIAVDSLRTDANAASASQWPLPDARGGRRLAYVMYTSGSTGKPKGVMVEQRGILRLVCNPDYILLAAEDNVAQASNSAFDASTFEIWAALLNGARLSFIGTNTLLDPDKLDQAISQMGITTLWMTTSLLAQTVSLKPRIFSRLKHLLFGGETIDNRAVDRMLESGKPRHLIHIYGPTENTSFTTALEIAEISPLGYSIGRPIKNTTCYVMGRAGELLPFGAIGELYAGGAGVARGYLDLPDLTAGKFVPDPYSQSGERLYRTGDVVRWLPGGDLQHISRIDHLVKIRGFRIELGEIEHALMALDDVDEASVVVCENPEHGKSLAAYVVLSENARHDGSAAGTRLKAAMSERLPAYMVPATIVILDRMPINANGKTDRSQLPAPDLSALGQADHEPPSGSLEERIAGIWSEVLRIEKPSATANFFDFGGNSLLMMRLCGRVRELFGIDVPFAEFFASPSIRQQASWLQEKVRPSVAAVPIERRPPADNYPLSLAQQRLWFLSRLDAGASAAYHMPIALRLSGTLDRVALRAALDRVVARHEALRAFFVTVDGIPRQKFAAKDCGFALIEYDLRNLEREARQQEAERLTAEETKEPFDLTIAPLIRGRLLQLAADENVLVVTQHHVITDGWSLGVMVREVATLYAAFTQGQPDPLPDLEIQYADYAVWQRQWLQGEELERQLDFWRGHLKGAPALLALPSDRPRPAYQSYAGESIPFHLSAELTAQLRELARRHDCTLFMVLLAGWSILLSRLSGQDEVVVGTPVANRQRREVEGLIGFFVNTLALRVRFDKQLSVAELLAQVKTTAMGAFGHQELPFEQVVEVLRPERSLSYSPVFQATLSLNNTADGGALELPGLTLTPMGADQGTTHFDLSLALSDGESRLSGAIDYASDLFECSTIERWAGHLQKILTMMVADEQCKVVALPLLSDTERRQVLHDFNSTALTYSREKLVHELFEAQAAQHPDTIAVVYEDQRMTYGQLNTRANQLAHYLIQQGVRPDDRVAICAERSMEMVIALLATLKAGGAFVPLDPVHPDERLSHMLRDSAPAAVLTQTALLTRLEIPQNAARVVLNEMPWETSAWGSAPAHNPAADETGLSGSNLAYVIYTSGSTGISKGVMVEHRNVLTFLRGMEECIHGIMPNCRRIAWNSSFGFDMAVKAWGQLARGRSLFLIPEVTRLSGDGLLNFLEHHEIEAIEATPSHLRAMQNAGFLKGRAASVRKVLLGGEVIDAVMWRELSDADETLFFNMYGPTECSVDASCTFIEGDMPNIGRVMPGASIYLLDEELQPVPIGVAGELYIGGAGVARGYHNRPELTAERFLKDPFNADPQARMYKTGDLGRWRLDGAIEYLGRNDFQVKIRGFRIELGEIEAKLLACAGVREAVVQAREDVPGDKRLVAYVVTADAASTAADLRQALLSVLPEYMVPSAFVMLEALPLTANGKLDRRALPAPDAAALVHRDYEAPQGTLEEVVASIWGELLGVERVGRHDHFFELGGHSLLIVTLVERLREQGLHMTVQAIFTAPTLSELAATLTDESHHVDSMSVPPNLIVETGSEVITPEMLPLVTLTQAEIDHIAATVPGGIGNIQDIYPLLSLQEGLLFHHLLEEEGDVYLSRSVLAFDSRKRLDDFLSALNQVIARHDALRSAMLWEGLPQPIQVVYRQAPMQVSILDVPKGEDVEKALRRHTDPRHLRLDLRRAPLLSAYVAEDCIRGEWLLALMNHQMVCDHVTRDLALSEVQTILNGSTAELPPVLPFRNLVAKTIQTPVAEQEAYFRKEFGDIDNPTAPFGMMDVHLPGTKCSDSVISLDAGLAQRIRACARREQLSPAVLFHVVWAQVLARCTGQEEVVFGTVVSGRLQGIAGADRMLGMLINVLPIRVSCGERTVHEAVQGCYRRMQAMLAHEHASLLLAQRCSGVSQPQPLFTTLLNYRHSHAGSGRKIDSSMEGIRLLAAEEATNYPITLSVDDFGDDFVLTARCVEGIDAERLNHYVITAVLGVVDALDRDSERLLSEVDVLPQSERRRLLHEFNATAANYPQHALIHELFESQAAAQPQAKAVEYEGQSLTYGELNARANQLAHYLIERGVKPDDRVAICMESSLEMIVGLLGVMKAGGAYVPLDPNYPSERLAYMLSESRPIVLLTQARVGDRLQDQTGSMLRLDTVDAHVLLTAQLTQNPDARTLGLTPQHLAYVIYTSGSTGFPKGVAMSQASLLNLLAWQRVVTPASERVLQFSALSFDVAFQEVFHTLGTGGCLLLADQAVRRDPYELVQFIETHQVQRIFLPFVALQRLVAAAEEGGKVLPSLMDIVTAGEQLFVSPAIREFFARVPGRRLHNQYGPTETHVVTAYTLDSAPERWGATPSIGFPIANTQIYILGAQGEPTPVGVRGELYIGGAGVARGYLNRPELTAERFLKDPFSADPQARMYKTGDLGRWRSDGAIEYLGRSDFQVKIRGFRIELGEIEAKLLACAGVREAVVQAREDVSGDKRLVAYVVSADAASTAADLRQALLSVLPEYMVPSAFVMLEALPLTANGKLDRRALPAPDAAARVHRDHEVPQGTLEAVMASIWGELLGVERVGRHDHFFELGGHSLVAVRVISALRARGVVDVSVRDVFECATLSILTDRVNRRTISSRSS